MKSGPSRVNAPLEGLRFQGPRGAFTASVEERGRVLWDLACAPVLLSLRTLSPSSSPSLTGGTNQGPAYYQECVSLFGKKVFMKPVNE